MINLDNDKLIRLFIALLCLIVAFHLLIVVKVIPYHIAWGGRLTNDGEMYVFETISIAINAFLSWILLMKGRMVRFRFSDKAVTTILWVFFVLFVLNTIGNVFAKTTFEKCFAVLTALFAFMIWQILRSKDEKD